VTDVISEWKADPRKRREGAVCAPLLPGYCSVAMVGIVNLVAVIITARLTVSADSPRVLRVGGPALASGAITLHCFARLLPQRPARADRIISTG
jgi:hypothetical protein